MQGILVRSGLSCSKKVLSSASGLQEAGPLHRGGAGGTELRECQVPSPQA